MASKPCDCGCGGIFGCRLSRARRAKERSLAASSRESNGPLRPGEAVINSSATKTERESGHIPGTARVQVAKNKGELTRARVVTSSKRPPKIPPPPRRLYDLEGTGAYLGIPVHTVREMIHRGDLPCVRIGRRQYLDIRDVDQFIDQAK